MNKNIAKSLVAVSILAMATGCADMSATQRGTATGAGVGAGLGAIIGGTTGGGGGSRATKGAVLGGAAGALIGNIWSNRMEKQKQEMEAATRGTGIQVSQTSDNRLKLEIPADVSFDTGRSDIKSNFRPVLERFAQTLNDNPAATVSIIGHTDSTGGADRLERQRFGPGPQPPRRNLRRRTAGLTAGLPALHSRTAQPAWAADRKVGSRCRLFHGAVCDSQFSGPR